MGVKYVGVCSIILCSEFEFEGKVTAHGKNGVTTSEDGGYGSGREC